MSMQEAIAAGIERRAEIDQLRAENKRLRALLFEARQYVSDAGPDDDSEVQRNSNALLEQIDTTLLSAPF